jgi:hypothetical protein
MPHSTPTPTLSKRNCKLALCLKHGACKLAFCFLHTGLVEEGRRRQRYEGLTGAEEDRGIREGAEAQAVLPLVGGTLWGSERPGAHTPTRECFLGEHECFTEAFGPAGAARKLVALPAPQNP